MKPALQSTLCICSSASLLLSGAIPTAACDVGGVTITNLPPFASSAYQPYALNSQGQLSGSLFISGVHAPQAFVYSDTGLAQLGTLGGSTSFGFAINSSGQVVGQADLSGGTQTHAFLYYGSMLDLGTLGGSSSSASAVNDSGLVVGESTLSGEAGPVAFRFGNGQMTSLGTHGGTYSSAFAVNNGGLIVGESYVTSGNLHAFASADGTIHDLGTLGGNYSSAFAVSASGVIVGESSLANGDTHAFASVNGTMVDLGTLGGTYSSAFGVNSNNQVIGNGTLEGDQITHGFLYDNGILKDIGTLGGANSEIWGINNLGQVVGNSDFTVSGPTHAFLWATNHMTDLNTLLPENSGWVLVSAAFINDAGRIVGYGTHNGVQSQWFVLDLGKGNQPPIANAGSDQTVDCQAQVTLNGSGSQDPDGDKLIYSWTMGGTLLGMEATLTTSLPLGTNTVTLTVTDTCGASSSTNVRVAVVDTTPPTGSCPSAVTVSADPNCQAAVPNLVPQVIASDNCTPKESLVISQDPPAGTLVGSGNYSISLTVTDGSGNKSTCTVPFKVADITAPTIVSAPGAVTVSAGANCQATVPNVLANVVATDNCTPASQLVLTQNPAAGTPIGTGQYTIVVTATDASGNSANSNVALQVVDTTPPTIVSAPASLTFYTGSDCQGVITNVLPMIVAADNCTPATQLSLSQNPAAGTELPPGQYTVVVTVMDAAGNTSSTNVPISIIGINPPMIQSLVASPNVLSPPNHQLVPVKLAATVSEGCNAISTTKIISITSNETVSPGDIQITGDLTAVLAATRNPSGGGRIYTITVQSTDKNMNSSVATVTVSVPQGNGSGSTMTALVRKK